MTGSSTLTPRPASASHVTLTQLMEVTDANIAGNVHGGVIMRLADTAAALAAARHSGHLCVTVSVDELSFRAPVHVGDVLTLLASVNDVGTTSLECGVRVEAENPIAGGKAHAATAYFVFVALDPDGDPRRCHRSWRRPTKSDDARVRPACVARRAWPTGRRSRPIATPGPHLSDGLGAHGRMEGRPLHAASRKDDPWRVSWRAHTAP